MPFDKIIEQVHFAFREEDSGYHGGHSTYRVRVSDKGALKLTPYRYNSSADGTNQPIAGASLELETASISRGERPQSAQALLVHSDEKAELDIERNQATEHLRNRENGVEQSWSFTHPPQGQGDLVLRIRAAGLAYAGQTEAGLHFSDPDSAMGVRYGAATWIDAHGARTSVLPSRIGDQIELRVPSRVIEQSAYPAVLDPVVGPEVGIDDPAVAPAFHSQTELAFVTNFSEQGLLVWTSQEFGRKHVYGARINLDYSQVLDPQGISLSDSPADQDSPAVAYFDSRYMVVWHDKRNGNGDIYGARVDARTGVVLDAQPIAISQRPLDQEAPAISADIQDFFVVWQDNRSGLDSDIYASRISAETGAVLDPTGLLISGALGNQSQPAMARNADGSRYYVVWTDERNGPESDIYGTRVDAASAAVESPQGTLLSSAPGRQWAPKVGVGLLEAQEKALVVWQDARRGTDSDVYASEWPGLAPTLPSQFDIPLAVLDGSNQAGPQISCRRSRDYCLIGWDDDRSGAGHEFYIRHYDLNQAATIVDSAQGTKLSHSPISTPVGLTIADYDSYFWPIWPDSDGFYTQRIHIAGPGDSIPGPQRLHIYQEHYIPAVAFDGTNYLIVWNDMYADQRQIRGARVRGLDGALLDPAGLELCSPGPFSQEVSLVFDGSQYWAAWQKNQDGHPGIAVTRVSVDGTSLDPSGITLPLNRAHPENPSLTVGANTVLVTWSESLSASSAGLLAARIRSDGSVLDPQSILVAANLYSHQPPTSVFDGSRYLVVWSGTRNQQNQLYAMPIDEAQATVPGLQGKPLPLCIQHSCDLALAFGASEYLVVWDDGSAFEATRLSPDLQVLGSTPLGGYPHGYSAFSAAWVQNQYVVTWAGRGADSQTDLYGRRLDAQGISRDPQPIRFTATPESESSPKIAAGLGDSALVVYLRRPLGTNNSAPNTRTRAFLFSALSEAQPCHVTGDCPNGPCADGYCCNSPCTGQCEACNEPGSEGLCTPIQGIPREERPGCPGSGLCQGSCDGVHTDSCVYPGTETSAPFHTR